MKSAKLFCQESLDNGVIKSLEIQNIGDSDAYNIRLCLPDEIMLYECDGLFPFPKLEAGRKIRMKYLLNYNYNNIKILRTIAYVKLRFCFTDEEGEKEFIFYLTTK